MLTKDLIKATTRKGRLYPKFIKLDDDASLEYAQTAIEFFKSTQGKEIKEVARDFMFVIPSKIYFARGFQKILSDRCEYFEVADNEGYRRGLLEKACEVRMVESGIFLEYEQFKELLQVSTGGCFDELSEKLYSDLPELRRIKSFKDISPEELIVDFNVQLVQGLLVRSDGISIEVKKSVGDIRYICRMAKFFGLLVEFVPGTDEDQISLLISGPMSIVGGGAKYGLNLAGFFRALTRLNDWILRADVEFNQSISQLILESSDLVCLVKKSVTNYIPDEFRQFANAFNEHQDQWQLNAGERLYRWGKDKYSFPDWTVTGSENSFEIELFHKWNAEQLKSRLDHLLENEHRNYMFGIERSLVKNQAYKAVCGKLDQLNRSYFLYSGIPKVRAILAALGSSH